MSSDSTGSESYPTPLHEFVALAREQGLAIDVSLYRRKGPGWDDYEGGVRLTGSTGDPMDVIASAVKALKATTRKDET